MNRQKLTGIVLVSIGVLLLVGSAYVIISYAGGVLSALIDFVTTNDLNRLNECGVNTPQKFIDLKGDLASVVLPALYTGIPLMLVVLSLLMFFGGYYYHKGRQLESVEKRKPEQPVAQAPKKYQ